MGIDILAQLDILGLDIFGVDIQAESWYKVLSERLEKPGMEARQI